MFFELLKYIYFFAPAGFANMAPIFTRGIFKKLAFPVDFHKKYKGRAIFGSHKTLRGIISGVIFGIVIAYLQRSLFAYSFFRNISLIDYSAENVLMLGLLMGLGALIGDMIESFFKRRLNIKPGSRFIPWDQIDWILGMIVFTYFIYPYTLNMIVILIIMAFILHIVFRFIGYYIKINKSMW